MLRKLPLAMAIALAIAPFQTQALGLGKITTRSALNEPFDGEIQLLSVPQGELDGVKVSLAPPEVFKRAGVDRPFSLSYLKFKTFRKPNGDAIIEVYSQKLIREPYLNFLVEVDWPKGRMVREFTVLLDPPLTTGRKSSPVSTPVTSSSPTITSTPSRPRSTGTMSDTGEYGPVQNNETLWTIANNYKPGNVSVNQMMMAILEENPEAFSSYNINTLKAGSILRMPSESQAKSLTRQQANELANRQYQDWKQGKMASAMPAATVAAEPAPEDAMPMPDSDAESDESAMLRLSGSDVALGSDGTGDSEEDVNQKLIAAQENLVTSQSEAEEMRTQMELMESQLADMKRLLELKDEQLAKLQAANDTDMTVDTEPEMSADEGMSAEEGMPAEGTMEEVAETAEDAVSDMSETMSAESEAVVEQMAETTDSSMETSETESPAMAEETAEPAAMAPEPVSKPKPAKEPSIIDMVTGSATMMGIAVAVLVVLLALIWAAFSRSKKRDDVSLDTKPAAPAKDVAPAATATAAQPAAAEAAEDESSFLSEFTPADLQELDNQETGEVDPLSEADVYIAYGRFDQAEEMVLQALEAEPGKLPYQHKLLEIYYSNKDAEKFSELAGKMHEAGAEEADSDAWNRAKLMGVELDPENTLFADAAEVPSQDVTDDLDVALSELESQLNDDVDDSVADLNAPSEDLEELNIEAEKQTIEEELPEFDLGDSSAAAKDEADEGIPTLELDDLDESGDVTEDTIPLPDVDLDTSSTTATNEEEAIEELATELENFDIDDVDTADVEVGAEAELPSEDDLMLPDEDLESFGELSELDDVSTKLDLARAYIEMGDKDGAKGILEEVVEEGSDAQKQEAQNMISEIS
jgi:pilus assembly protein FimV